MARLGRYFLPDPPLHVIRRGNNREAIFFAEADYDDYRGWLADAAAACGCAIHADVLMTNHVHLLVTPRRADSLPRTMQSLGRGYVRHINATYRRTGTLWEGRYRAAPIDSEALGGARFKRQIAAALGRRVAPMPKGRPPKHKPDRRQLSPL
jgi:putative transposase